MKILHQEIEKKIGRGRNWGKTEREQNISHYVVINMKIALKYL